MKIEYQGECSDFIYGKLVWQMQLHFSHYANFQQHSIFMNRDKFLLMLKIGELSVGGRGIVF